MKTSDSIDLLSTALAKAQGEIGTVTFNKINPHFKSKYADLSVIREASKMPLTKNEIAIIQAPSAVDGRCVLITMLIHKSGQWLQSELSLKPDKDTPQAMGSAITYARRYALASLLGIVADEDDDGNAASPKPQTKPTSIEKKNIFDKTNEKSINWLKNKMNEKGLSGEEQMYVIDELDGKDFLTEYKKLVDIVLNKRDSNADK